MKCFNCKLEITGFAVSQRLCWHCAHESVNASGDTITCPNCLGVGATEVFQAATKTKAAGVRPVKCETCAGARRIPKDAKVRTSEVYSFWQEFPLPNKKHRHPCPNCRTGYTPCYLPGTACELEPSASVVCMNCTVRAARERMFVTGYAKPAAPAIVTEKTEIVEKVKIVETIENEIVAIYADGGVIRKNPSTIGGTWAWCGVNAKGERVIERYGAVPATPTRPITNNHTEQIALTLALEAMPVGWNGTAYSDSKIALGRVFEGWRETNLPGNISDRSRKARARLGSIKTVLLQGHPTKDDLEKGIGKKRGLPVSIHNVWCDKACGKAAEEFVAAQPEADGT